MTCGSQNGLQDLGAPIQLRCLEAGIQTEVIVYQTVGLYFQLPTECGGVLWMKLDHPPGQWSAYTWLEPLARALQ